MKISISLPNPVFRDAERLAHGMKISRSQLYRSALEEYVARHAPDHETEAMNFVCDSPGKYSKDRFMSAATRHLLEQSEWRSAKARTG